MAKNALISCATDSVVRTSSAYLGRRESARLWSDPSSLANVNGRGRAAFLPELRQLRLVAGAVEELEPSMLAREFPTITVECGERVLAGDLAIDDFAWRGAFDARPFDELVHAARPLRRITVRGVDAVGVAIEVMARYQRLVMRRNEASATPLFDAVLGVHASLFDAATSLGRTGLEHALDTWQWMLRIAPNVGLAPQIAALFHDVDRLDGPIHEQLEHRARRSFDHAEAVRHGEAALAALRGLDLTREDLSRVRDLVGGSPLAEPDIAVLDDAETLSFLSLMSSRYADYFGLAQTRRKVAFMLARLGPVARRKLTLFRLRPDVDRLLAAG